LDHLPPTVTDEGLLALLGGVLAVKPTQQSDSALRLQFFQPDFSWQALVDLAAAHEVLPPLILSLRERALLPPLSSKLTDDARSAHVTSRLAAAYADHLGRQSDLRQQLFGALTALNAADIVPVLLKGAVHLTLQRPPWHEARAMRDLDLLVGADDASRAHALLASLGYRADPNPPPLDRHLPELFMPGRAGTIEIHTDALSFPARYALTTDEVLRQAEERNFDGTRYKVLPSHWHALHGLLHHQLSDRGHARRMLTVKGVWEFARASAELSPRAWDVIVAHAEERKILDMLSSWAVQANRLFELEAPDALLRFEFGRKHADATFKRARMAYGVRQALFVADKLNFAFAPRTLALRYGESSTGGAALRHIGFLWSRRGQMARRWLGL
jgi:Uncharacterised nucleotidyltransferase